MTIKHFPYHLILFLFINFAATPSHANLPADVVLKTEISEDPYAYDGISFRVLCYHDARDHVQESFKTWPERGALDTTTIIEQFEWLRENGYHVVSLDAILAARKGGQKLPPKAVLLTFDDGYVSMYTHIFPLLKLFNYPAVIGLVGEWMENSHDGMVFYGDRWISRKHFVTWPQVREMVASGLVEVGSHSYGLHKGVVSNPQGSLPSAAITRIYNPKNKNYESDNAFIARIRADLARNSALIARETGKKPRVMIWPYGAYNQLGIQAALAEEMPIVMTLEAGSNTADQPLSRIRRNMLVYHDRITDFKHNLNQPASYDGIELPLTRIVAVNLDAIFDADPIKQEKNIGVLVERIKLLGVNTVYIRAVADLNNDGYADAAYFPNRHLPMRTDLFNRVAWQLLTRAAIPAETFYAYAWLPIDKFSLPSGEIASAEVIKDIYADAGKNAPRIGGLLMGDLINAQANHAKKDLTSFSEELISIFKIHQPYAFTARLLPADYVLYDETNHEGLITMSTLLKHYDFVTLSISQKTAAEDQGNAALETLVKKVAQTQNSLKSTAFLVSASPVTTLDSSKHLAEQMRHLQQNGARNFGYYSDQEPKDLSMMTVIRPAISLHTNPGK